MIKLTIALVATVTLGVFSSCAFDAAHASTDLQDSGYLVERFECGTVYGSGSHDSHGDVYIPCGDPTVVKIFSADGALKQNVELGFASNDIAPSPDGAYLYATRCGPAGCEQGAAAPVRLARGDDGRYAIDPGWRLQGYPMDGYTYPPGGHFIATDGIGNIYLADGAWGTNLTHTVVKYESDGSLVTRFGRRQESWAGGSFWWQLNGLTVNPDGTRVYTVEGGNNRVQRWDLQADGAYGAVDVIGSTEATNPTREAIDCVYGSGWQSRLASPYDAGLDAEGNLYVLNTTCHEVVRFTLDGRFAGVTRLGEDRSETRPHGFAISRDGDVYVGQAGTILRSPRPAPAPAPPPPPATPHPPISPADPPSQGQPPAPVHRKRLKRRRCRKRHSPKKAARHCRRRPPHRTPRR
jgi:sugar lactone lactonase YvrE